MVRFVLIQADEDGTRAACAAGTWAMMLLPAESSPKTASTYEEGCLHLHPSLPNGRVHMEGRDTQSCKAEKP